ncbi:MAG: metallophosphoesterase [Candidatus Bathyarchaeia archaeon]
MKIQLVSDLHVDAYRNRDDYFAQDLDPKDCETLIVAGDLAESWYLQEEAISYFEVLCDKYPNVVYVLGNHEYYGSSFEETQDRFAALDARFSNLFCLDNESVVIEGVSIAGTTLWFKDTPMNPVYERFMSDFNQIQHFTHWVYDHNKLSVNFLKGVGPVDVVVTHHMPSSKSVHAKYAQEPTNLYFLCDVSEIMLDMSPKVWCHGHTHINCDYQLGNTRVVCNPRGYPGENSGDYQPLTIDI